ncbi:hypothetical protein N665_0741s0010 [Sinapis alba]|nr:hypothetical protein N665_0741s0010 [Sinapis alba]
MMTNASLIPVENLKPYKIKWRSQIHATCKRDHMLSVQRKLPLGRWHVLSTFYVSQASGQYRPAIHPYKITIVKAYDQNKVQFHLVDSSGKDLACCLRGKYVEQLKAYDEREQPLICLIRFANISEVQLTNAFDAFIVYLDPTMEEALHFKEKEIVLQEDDCNHLEIKMISKLFVANQLHLIVRDDTETCKLMLFNTVAKTIVGHEAVDLWDDSYDEVIVTYGAETFKVLEVWCGDKILKVESQSEPTSMIDTSSSTMSSCDVLMLEENSHNESEECKTPFSKRKEEDDDLPYIASTSKKLCTSIKM